MTYGEYLSVWLFAILVSFLVKHLSKSFTLLKTLNCLLFVELWEGYVCLWILPLSTVFFFFLMLRLRWQSMDRMGVVIFITSELHTFCLWFTWDSLEGIPLAMTHFPLWWCEHAESLKCSLPTYGEQVTRMNQGRTQ